MSRPESPSDRLRRALRPLAEEDAAELIAEARDAARTRALRLIEDALVDELLEAAAKVEDVAPQTPRSVPVGEPPETSVPVGERAGSGDAAPSSEAWWTYGVLRSQDTTELPKLEGVELGTAVEVFAEGELAALVSAVPVAEYGDERLREHLEDLAWVERVATRHEAVLEEALQRVTIVPLRLCTLYHDRDGVRRFLREHGSSLTENLTRVDGCEEWGLKLFADPRVGEEAAGAGEPSEGEPDSDHEAVSERPGATYLIQRQRDRERAARAAEVRARCVEAVHEQVSRVAREAIRNPPQRPEAHGRDLAMLLNGAYLVGGDRVGELHAVLGDLQAKWGPRGFVIELTGPWPAYNFVYGGTGAMP